MTRTSEVVLEARNYASLQNAKERYSTINCGLNPKRNDNQVSRLREPALQPIFQRIAACLGIYRHVVSLVANQIVIDNHLAADCDWKTFYDRIWSAVEAAIDGKMKDDKLHIATRRILQPFVKDLKATLPPKELFDLRQQEAAQLATQTKEHIKQFPDRLTKVLSVRIAVMQPHLKWNLIGALARRTTYAILSAPKSLDVNLTKLMAFCKEDGIKNMIMQLVAEERTQLGALVTEDRRYADFMLSINKNLHLLLPHLIRLSAWSEAWLKEHFDDEKSDDKKGESDDNDSEAGAEIRKWRRERLPRPFSALPVSKLQASMVLYTLTEVQTLLRSKKRKAEMKDGISADFGAAIFNMESFKGRKGNMVVGGRVVPKWRIAAFRTDGISATITFVSGSCAAAPNVDTLMEKGYNIVAPENPVDVMTANRGLYVVHENRCDIAPSATRPNITVVDPGFVNPIAAAFVPSEAVDPISDAHYWSISEDEWMEASGRRQKQDAEVKRRNGTAYGACIKQLCDEGRRRSVGTEFTKYLKGMLQSLHIRAKELVGAGRSAARWMHKRKMMGFISRICDRLFVRTTLRANKSDVKKLSDEERNASLQRLHKLRKERREQKPTIVFFGDGGFGPTTRGHNAIPKKKILKELCHRGLTLLLDEFKTSKMCPCGQDELKTTTQRFRGHKTDGSECHFLKLGNDRDTLATMCLIDCSLCACAGKKRPAHLCRQVCMPCADE